MEKEIYVLGMKCEGCANNVRNKFEKLDEVESVSVDFENKKFLVKSQHLLGNEIFESALLDTRYSVLK